MKRNIAVFIVCLSLAAVSTGVHYFKASANENKNDVSINECTVNPVPYDMHIPKETDGESVYTCDTEENTEIAEDIIIDKDYVANHMLNAVDYYNSAEGSFKTSLCADVESVVDFKVDKDFAYENLYNYKNGSIEVIDYNGKWRRYNHNVKMKVEGRIYGREDTPEKIAFTDRMGVTEDGENIYYYRPKRLMFASECEFPQELAFGLLGDFSLWDIDGETEFLGYPVIVVKGITEKDYGVKLGMQSFMLYIEKSSGILMKLEGYDADGNITQYIEMQDIAINKGLLLDKEKLYNELEEKSLDYERA